VLVAAACSGKEGPSEVSPVKTITVTLTPQILVGATAQATAVLVDADGVPVIDRRPTWTSLTPAVVSVSPTGVVTGLQAGGAAVRASSGAASGDAPIVVTNPRASSITFSRDTATVFIPNGAVQVIATVKDETGNIIAIPTIFWQSTAPLIATVNGQGLVTGLAGGTATIKASIDGQTAQMVVTVKATPNISAPVVVGINPGTLRPGGTFTVVGNNFGATIAGNVVVVDGVPVTVNAATTSALSVTLPTAGFSCDPTRTVFLQITANGLIGGGSAPLRVANVRTLLPGQSVVVSAPAEVRCNELSQTGGRYVVSVYNAYRSTVLPSAAGNASVVVRGAIGAALASATASRVAAPATARRSWTGAVPLLGSQAFDAFSGLLRDREVQAAHHRLLERNIDYLRASAPALRARFALPRPLAVTTASQLATIGAVTQLKVPNLDASSPCSANTPVGVRTVFVGTHSIIVEDTISSFNGKPTLQGQMNTTFTQLGQEFENVMWPILAGSFGNPLALDAQLSGTEKVVMVFSPRVNAMQQGRVQGFVVTCDFQTVAQAPSSNVGEYFYASVPTSAGTGYADPETRDSWLRNVRATVIHEVKHLVQFAERLSRSLPFEEVSWEEGMARNVEELYARTFYGTLATQNTIYAASVGCDLRFTFSSPPQCANRPLLMLRHFDALYQYLSAPEGLSPLGRTFASDATFYASAWSIERWANDHFGTNESQFLKDWTVSPVTGVQNLEARTGRPWEESVGEWSLALYLDDDPTFTPENPRLRFPSWNLRDIWLGLCSDEGPCASPATVPQFYPRANPFQPRLLSFGAFTVNNVSLAGGTFTIFELTGPQIGNQVFEIRSATGGDPASTIRLAIARVQ
jgi:hypothetical protein